MFLQTLEFHKILSRLSEYTQNETVKNRILGLEPTASLEEARLWQSETTEGLGMILRRGNPPGLKAADITPSLLRTERGGSLTMR